MEQRPAESHACLIKNDTLSEVSEQTDSRNNKKPCSLSGLHADLHIII